MFWNLSTDRANCSFIVCLLVGSAQPDNMLKITACLIYRTTIKYTNTQVLAVRFLNAAGPTKCIVWNKTKAFFQEDSIIQAPLSHSPKIHLFIRNMSSRDTHLFFILWSFKPFTWISATLYGKKKIHSSQELTGSHLNKKGFQSNNNSPALHLFKP